MCRNSLNETKINQYLNPTTIIQVIESNNFRLSHIISFELEY